MADDRIQEAVDALADEEVRQRVAAGDFADVEGFGLTAEATAELQTFAAEIPDIEDRVGKAIEALEDDDVRQRVADGDYADVEGFGLTPDEAEQLKTMAAEWSEVEGFLYGTIHAQPGQTYSKGASLIFDRQIFGSKIKFTRYPQTIDRTASTQPLGGLQAGGATI